VSADASADATMDDVTWNGIEDADDKVSEWNGFGGDEDGEEDTGGEEEPDEERTGSDKASRGSEDDEEMED
jgi:hypothetical protein